MKKYKFNFSNIAELLVNFFKKLAWVLGKKAFLTTLILILAGILLGESLFYKYFVLASKREGDFYANPLKFKESQFNSILQKIKEREATFNKPGSEINDPFK